MPSSSIRARIPGSRPISRSSRRKEWWAKILAIFPHDAQVLLITDSSSGVGVTLSQSRVQGILKGGTDDLCELHYVMNEETVARGEPVITSGLDQVYPKGLPVGTVVPVGAGMFTNRLP